MSVTILRDDVRLCCDTWHRQAVSKDHKVRSTNLDAVRRFQRIERSAVCPLPFHMHAPGLARCGTITNSDVLSNESSTMTGKSSAISADFHWFCYRGAPRQRDKTTDAAGCARSSACSSRALLERARIWTTEIARLGSTLFLKVRIAADIGPPGGGRSEHFLDQGSIAIRAPSRVLDHIGGMDVNARR